MVLFRANKIDVSLKRFLNTFNVTLRDKRTLYDVFGEYTRVHPHSYIIVFIGPDQETAQVYSNVLLSDGMNLLTLHDDELHF